MKKILKLKLLRFFNLKKKPSYDYLFDRLINDKKENSHNFFKKYFLYYLPFKLIQHRKYFASNKMGFGEDAFHVLWYLLFNKYEIKDCLEIGVYRGQVISLWALIAKIQKKNINVTGISPFDSSGDQVSSYIRIDYYQDVINNFQNFDLKEPILIRDISTGPQSLKCINSKSWDLIYIDGSHDYEIVKEDAENSISNIKKNGLLVFDDSSLFFEYNVPKDSFKGHPGPSKVVNELLSDNRLKYLGGIGHNNIFEKK